MDIINIDDHSDLEYPSSPEGDCAIGNGHETLYVVEPQGKDSDPGSKNFVHPISYDLITVILQLNS